MNKFFITLGFLFVTTLGLAQPCMDPWGYRLPITIDNTTNPDPLVDYQLRFVVNSDSLIQAGQLKVDGSDLRITNSAGVALPFWIENGTINTDSTIVWVNVDNIPPMSLIDVFMFYGNSNAVSVANGDNTFLHYDNFDGTALDFGKWTFCGGPGGGTIPNVTNGIVTFASNSTVYNHTIKSLQTFQGPITTEMNVVSSSVGISVLGQTSPTSDGYGMALEDNLGVFSMRLISSNAELDPDLCLDIQNQTPISNVSSGAFQGLWSFTWSQPNEQLFSWPNGNELRTDFLDSAQFHSNKNVYLGSFDNTGSLSVDYTFTRKYSPIVPSYSYGVVTELVDKVTATTNATICVGDTLKLFSPSFQGAVYSWVGPNGFTSTDQNPIFPNSQFLQEGKWVVTVSAPTNCSVKSDSVIVDFDSIPNAGTLFMDRTVCEAIANGVVNVTNITGNIIYWESANTINGPWNTISTQNDSVAFNNLLNTQHYRVFVESGVCGVDTSNTVTITVDPTTEAGVIIGGDIEKCEGSNVGTLTLTGRSGSVEFWQSSIDQGATWDTLISSTNQLNYSDLDTTTLFRAQVKNGVCPARLSDTTVININPLPKANFEADSVCFGNATTFINSSTLSQGTIENYSWNFDDGTSSIDTNVIHTFGDDGIYAVTLSSTTAKGCKDDTTINVAVYAQPELEFNVNDECIFKGTLFKNLSTIDQGTLTYNWTFGDDSTSIETSPTHTYNASGFYAVQLIGQSNLGCTDSLVKIIEIFPLPLVDAGADQTISFGFDTELLGMTGSPNSQVLWSPGNVLNDASRLKTIARPQDTTTFTLSVVSEFGCANSDQMTVNVKNDFRVEATNIITPNGDGKNDTWNIVNAGSFEKINIRVYDRWGASVYKAENYREQWDGTVNFDQLPDGVYYYNITFDESAVDYQGSITLLR